MPMRLDEGWNQIQFNLSDFTRRAYGTNYVETLRVQVTLTDATYDGGVDGGMVGLTLRRPLLPYGYSYKASCARPG